MDLKRKLVTSFLLVVILPVILAFAMGKMIISYQLKSIEQMFGLEVDTMQIISNPMQIMNKVTRGVYNRIMLTAEQNPEKFAETEYLEALNDELLDSYSFLVVKKNDVIVFAGNSAMTERMSEFLPDYGGYQTDVDGGIYVSGKNPVLIKQKDFLYDDGSTGSVFIVTDVTNLVPQIKTSAIQSAIAFAGILMMTALIVSAWLYQGIIRPLNRLKVATRHLKEGNLNYSITGSQEDEIGQLCEDFEEMRIHLKEQIEVRLQYEKDMAELISNVSHDLKTPLTAIKGYAEGLLDGVADTPERRDKYIRTIYTKANDMSVLVDELALYSKIDCNTVPYNFIPLQVSEYFDDCVEELRLDLEVEDIELEYENNVDAQIKALVDPEQMKRVINNIVGNAVKYAKRQNSKEDSEHVEKGRISIRINELGEFIQIGIEDNGTGIAKEDLPHIFERFYRADTARTTKHGGTGLGLSIARKIVEDHEGQIWAMGEKGVGTTIYFTIKKWTKISKNRIIEEDFK